MKKNIPPNMSPKEIRKALIDAEVSQSQIAREVGVSAMAVHLIIDGKFTSDRIRRKIAEKIGLDVSRIWPDPYLTGGPRKAGRPKAA